MQNGIEFPTTEVQEMLVRPILGGLLWVSLAPLFYSAMSASAKVSGDYLNVWQIGTGRFLLGLIVVPVIVRSLRISLWGQNRFLLIIRGLCGAGAFLLLLAAFQRIPLSVAMVLFYLYPAFTSLFSAWVAGEPTSKSAWPFVCGAFTGTTLILWPDQAAGTFNLGHLLAIIASVLCAFTILLVRRLARENNIYTLFFYLCLTGTLASLGPLLMQDGPILPVQAVGWIGVGAVGIFSIGAQLTINQALIHIPAPKVSVMMTTEVPLLAGFGVVILGEPLGWRLLVGALIVFGCGIGLNLLSAKSPTV
jgi:drug/metabolite transporter (DMT)-like permease